MRYLFIIRVIPYNQIKLSVIYKSLNVSLNFASCYQSEPDLITVMLTSKQNFSMKTTNLFLCAIVLTITTLTACKKEGETTIRLNMTDAPAAYEEVNVDLQQVNLKFEGSDTGWVSMKTKAGIYNLLGLQNGI